MNTTDKASRKVAIALHKELAQLLEEVTSNKDIDTSDIPELDDKFFEDATLTLPGESLIDKEKNGA